MSLGLVADYSSDEEPKFVDSDSEDQPETDDTLTTEQISTASSYQPSLSLLPSADDAFRKVKGPPEFLKNSASHRVRHRARENGHYTALRGQYQGVDNIDEASRPVPNGAVIEAKAVLVDASELSTNEAEAETIVSQNNSRSIPGANMPSLEDAAALLRMCPNCAVPKTYSGTKEAMVCPLCGDRPLGDEKGSAVHPEKRTGSKIKDKEKNKRMKGQSSHATWKSETEMQLRQQFD